ncbi:kinase-like protein [Aspergillus steynii IBT 23096]|uniref:Kinase-like protein n=1 Tax=Aspergillus steynii IBT 23096 TaxID=1392250 RepID=A0A2I2GG15_9EURO|nr:kinase-like protein [Aspergillus steynii IBT 23096]PLB51822.1 kinase-like protein [Aspergillus steynii IBT 23096]
MKKLHHNNLVSLIEVLDDPTEDSLYMVMEMCKKGVVMKVGLEERADPYEDALCRCWFRDLILGIEYLHAQGIVHRDIKPDNCLVTSDDVLKIVDFGVSEMFEKDSDMFTAKSAGSPAFLPPELCVVKHGDVSGKAADIWSMGVTLYCLRYGKLPFEKQSIFELYDAIKNDPIVCEGEIDDNFKDLMSRILEKDPTKRITMDELRSHPWVTRDGLDPLLPESENTAEIIGLPTEEEMNSAITKNIGHVLAVMKAVKNFKRLIDPAKAEPPMQSILGQEYESHFVQPPLEMEPEEDFSVDNVPVSNKSQSLNTFDRRAQAFDNVRHGYHLQREEGSSNQPLDSGTQTRPSGDISTLARSVVSGRKDSGSVRDGPIVDQSGDDMQFTVPQSPSAHVSLSRASSATTKRSVEGTRGHARDPLEEEFPFLFIGPSTYTGSAQPVDDDDTDMEYVCDEPDRISDAEAEPIVSESPGAAEFDIYETAYRQEIERIRERNVPRQGTVPKVYLTRRVEGRDDVTKLVQDEDNIGTIPRIGKKIAVPSGPRLTSAVSAIKAQVEQQRQRESRIAESSPQSPSQVPEPTSSSLAATGTSAAEPSSPENSRAKLYSLFDRVTRSQ